MEDPEPGRDRPLRGLLWGREWLGRDSRGLEIKKPLRPAAFSPWFPNPKPEVTRLAGVGANSDFSLDLKNEPTYELSGRVKMGLLSPTGGRTSSEPDLQARIERFCLALGPKTSPRRILRQPMEKRKNAATRVKSST